jgi:hypothetical protein
LGRAAAFCLGLDGQFIKKEVGGWGVWEEGAGGYLLFEKIYNALAGAF